MEDVDPVKSAYLEPLTLFSEDLAAIIKIWRNNTSRHKMVIGGKIFSNLDDVLPNTNRAPLHSLQIEGWDPYLTLSIYPHEIRLYVGSTKPTPLGLFTSVLDVLKQAEKRPRALYAHLLPNILMPFVACLSFVNYRWYFTIILPSLALLAIWHLNALYWRHERRAVIRNQSRYETPSFWSRYGNTFLVGLFSAVISGVMVAIILKVFRLAP